MSTQPYMWPFSMFAPGNLEQAINPGWFDVNINYAGNPQIEKDVVEKVASYGKQLGILTDAVLALAAGKPDDKALKRLKEIADEIEKLKSENKAALRKQARDVMARLAKIEPGAAQRLGREYAGKSSA